MSRKIGSKISGFGIQQLSVDGRLIVVLALILAVVIGMGIAQTALAVGPENSGVSVVNADEMGRIIVRKHTSPNNDPQVFPFVLSGPNGYSATANLTDGHQYDSGLIPPGTGYVVTETLTSITGWRLDTVVCEDSEGVVQSWSNLTVRAGITTQCDFFNDKLGKITIIKDAQPDSSQQFDFTLYHYGETHFSLVDDGTGVGNTKVFENVKPGFFAIEENNVEGWDKKVECVLTGGTAENGVNSYTLDTIPPADWDVQLYPGQEWTCTFVNIKRGTIIVEKLTDPEGLTDVDFEFTGDASGVIQSGGQIVVSNLVPGVYTSTETLVDGFELTDISCDDKNSSGNLTTASASFHLDPGETVKCTFTNTKYGTITIVKDAIPTGSQAFSFTTSGTGLSNFSLTGSASPATNSTTFSGLLPGSYTITEAQLSGWDLNKLVCTTGGTVNLSNRTATIALEAGASVTCTFTNTKRGNIVVIKQTDPDGATQSFEFTPSWGAKFTLKDGQSKDSGLLQPGTYSVAETAADGWTLASATCSDKSSPSSIQLDAGETVTCTFVNNQKPGSLKVTKTVLWNGTPDTTKEFEICILGPSYPSTADCKTIGYNGGDLIWSNLIVGTYDVSETDPGEKWTVTITNTTVSVPAGGQGVAFVNNTYTPDVPGEKLPSLSAEKSDGLLIDVKDDGEVNAGDTLVYTVTIKNTGEGDAKNVVFTDTPDANTKLVVGTVTTSQGTVVKGNTAGDTSIEVSIGTVPALVGEVTIYFDVKINDPLDPSVKQVENQGIITSDNHKTIDTDDPTTPKPTDPTVTPIVEVPTAVGLINFYVLNSSGNQITLAWSTAWEDANLGFYIYRAPHDATTNEVDFTQATQVGFVNSKYPNGTAVGLAEYTYTDVVPANGRWYYWLVDVDAQAKTSAQLNSMLSYRVGPAPVFLPMVVTY